jgi:hypothetical protein
VSSRCFLVYALAPEGMSAREANDRLNAYAENADRGIPLFHDHFTGRPHGGFAVVYPRTDEERARLEDPGPLEGWSLAVHPLVFALTPVGFDAQMRFTLGAYGKATLEELAAAEEDDPRYWWRRERG